MTTLHEYHQQSGYAVPLRYRTHAEECRAASVAAMCDCSFLGKLYVSGKDREALLHRLTTNEMRNLPAGKTRVNVFTTAKGRVLDRVEMLAEAERYLLLTGPERGEIVRAWLDKYTFIEEVKCVDASRELAVIALFGAESAARLQEILQLAAHTLAPGSFLKHNWNGSETIVHVPESASAARFNLIVPQTAALKLWEALLPAFAPMGYEAFETLRVLQGIPMAGHELTEDYNPHEVGLYALINFEKGCYIGQEVVARLDTYQKVQRQLFGVKLEAAPQNLFGATLWIEQHEIGKLTSVAHAPDGTGAIGLAVVRKQNAQAGAAVEARTNEGTALRATLAALPFSNEELSIK